MNREQEIQQQIDDLQAQLVGLAPIDRMSIREFAKLLKISPTTAAKLKDGGLVSKEIMKKALPE